MIWSNERRALTNEQLSTALDEIAELLQEQGANQFRVCAYRSAAETVRHLPGSAAKIVSAEGAGGLLHLPGIGQSIARAVNQLVRSGRLPLLERLREGAPEQVFATVPDIGKGLARRIHERLGIETLAELNAAAGDGRLAQVPGMGRKRIRAVRESLAGRFALMRRKDGSTEHLEAMTHVPIDELLEIDAQYRTLAKQDKLPRIAPRRFNPTHAAWLPVLHTSRDDRHYTALFSNTARAHEMGTTFNWVVIYRDDREVGHWTVITANYGPLRGHRIVRGREGECEVYYANLRNGALEQRQQ